MTIETEGEPAYSRYNEDIWEEQDANLFAGDAILGGRAEELVKKCEIESRGRMEWLKAAVVRISRSENVPVDGLANYMAYRLSLQGQNWWGAANNLQGTGTDPWETARDLFAMKADFGVLSSVDRDLLTLALKRREA